MKYFIKITGLCIVLALFACKGTVNDKEGDNDKDTTIEKVSLPNNFNSDSAYLYIKNQVDFGPRVPNTEAHRKCSAWIESMIRKWSDTVYIQSFIAKSYKGEMWNAKNIIGTYNPHNLNRLLLCAHWDTRPQADQDKKDPTTPSDGANDGASGVGVLLEIARQLHAQKPALGIDIIFLDVEDGGANEGDDEKTWCLGAQYWSKNPHVVDYRAKNGILLDMVGTKNALFAREQMSVRFDNRFLVQVWQTAASLGFGNYFINYDKAGITDDHVYLSYEGKVPTIDIIDYSPNTSSGFGAYWHTHDDNMSVIDKNTLLAVGKTVLQVVYNSEAGILY